MLVQLEDKQDLDNENTTAAVYRLAPRIMDYLREVFLYRGKVLFVEEDNIYTSFKQKKIVLRTLLLFCLTYFFKCSAYETWSLINSQVRTILIHFLNYEIKKKGKKNQKKRKKKNSFFINLYNK